MNDITLTTHEKDNYDYVYVDENNQVHLLCPITGGDTIGLDNTCQSTKEIKQFFGISSGTQDKSAIAVLTKYRSDLEYDIALLGALPDSNSNNERQKNRAFGASK